MMKQIFISLFALLLFHSCVAAEDINSEIREYVGLLAESVKPTLSDYYRFYGEGSEGELALEHNLCEKKGWTPPLSSSHCNEFIKKRRNNRNESQSLYFEWLKTKLPASPRLKIIKIMRIRDKNILNHDLIYATLDGINVVFFKTIGDKENLKHFGVISISEINGIHVQELLHEDLNKAGTEGVSP